jgi:hypothetical protein
MNIFLLATLASVVLYYGGRVALTLYVSALKIDLSKPGFVVTGVIPNLLAVLILLGFVGMWINSALLIAYLIKPYL